MKSQRRSTRSSRSLSVVGALVLALGGAGQACTPDEGEKVRSKDSVQQWNLSTEPSKPLRFDVYHLGRLTTLIGIKASVGADFQAALDDADLLAEMLGVEVPLPPRGKVVSGLKYTLTTAADAIGPVLAEHSREDEALLRLAMLGQFAATMYSPDGEFARKAMARLEKHLRTARIPAALLSPVRAAVRARSPRAEGRPRWN